MQKVIAGKTVGIVVAFIALVQSEFFIATQRVADSCVTVVSEKLFISFEGASDTTAFFV